MFDALARSVFGSANDRYVKGLSGSVDAINGLEPEMEALSDAELKARTDWLKGRAAAGEGRAEEVQAGRD